MRITHTRSIAGTACTLVCSSLFRAKTPIGIGVKASGVSGHRGQVFPHRHRGQVFPCDFPVEGETGDGPEWHSVKKIYLKSIGLRDPPTAKALLNSAWLSLSRSPTAAPRLLAAATALAAYCFIRVLAFTECHSGPSLVSLKICLKHRRDCALGVPFRNAYRD